VKHKDDIQTETLVSAALVFRVPFDDLARIKAEIAAIDGIKIVYQKISVGRLTIVEG